MKPVTPSQPGKPIIKPGRTPAQVRSAILKSQGGEHLVRGYQIPDLMGRVDFGEHVFLLMTGQLPTKRESIMFNAVLVCLAGGSASSTASTAARAIISTSAEAFQSAVAGGLLAYGFRHVGAVEQATRMLLDGISAYRAKATDEPSWTIEDQARVIVEEFVAAHTRIPGLGDPSDLGLQEDTRNTAIYALAEKLGFLGDHVRLMRAIEAEAKAQLAGRVPEGLLIANPDGSAAAVLSDMVPDLDWRSTRGLILIARTPTIVAHVYEAISRNQSTQYPEWIYDGPDPLPFPDETWWREPVGPLDGSE